jgi:hypothetical protein
MVKHLASMNRLDTRQRFTPTMSLLRKPDFTTNLVPFLAGKPVGIQRVRSHDSDLQFLPREIGNES